MYMYHCVCARLLNSQSISQSTLAPSSLNDDRFSSQYLLFFFIWFLLFLFFLSYQSFYLTCVYTFLTLSLLILLSCSSCWEWANHSIHLENKSVFLYNKYPPQRYVLHIRVNYTRRKKEENWTTSRHGDAGLQTTLTICLQTHTHEQVVHIHLSVNWSTKRRFCSFSRLLLRPYGCQWLYGTKRGQWTIILWLGRLINYNVSMLFNCLSFFLLKYRCYSF
jgi:hypothetical protein